MGEAATIGTATPAWALLAGVAAVLLLLTIGVAAALYLTVTGPRRRLRKRIAALGLSGPGGGKGGKGQDASAVRQRRIQEKLQELEAQKKKRSGRRNQIRADLLQAGLDIDHRKYLLFMIASGIGATVVLIAIGMGKLLALLLGLVAAFGLPKLVLKMMAASRQKRFTAEFANAVDVLVRGIRSGLPIGECLAIIGREIPDPVGQEFRLLVEGQKLGMSIDDLLRRGLERFPTAEYRFFAIVIQIQQQTGGNLAETLAGLSNVLRLRKQLRDKVKALSSEARSSAMIIGSLPFLVGSMVYLMNPDYVGLLFTDRTGNFMLAGGLTWMGLGVAVMVKMVNFKI